MVVTEPTHSKSSSGETESESESESESKPISDKTSKPTDSTSDDESESESESESEPETVKTSKAAPTSSSSSEESESESEPTTKPISSTPTVTVTTMPIEPAKSSSSEESESESDTEPEAVEKPKLDTISSSEESIKPPKMASESETAKPLPISSEEEEEETEKLDSPQKLPDQSKAAGKRPMSELEDGHSKRAKMGIVIALAAPAAAAAAGVEKKQLFQRLYSEENEIELIQGMISFVQQKCKDPGSDIGQFYEFVKGSLNVDVTHKQLITKIRKLKLKYRNNAVKVETNGKVRSLNNSHEKRMYELSEKVWGNGSNNNVRSSKKVKTVTFGNGSEEVKPKFVSRNESNIPDEITRCVGFEKLSEAEKIEMEKKWEDIKVQELKLYITKVALMKEQAELVLKATIKSGNGAK